MTEASTHPGSAAAQRERTSRGVLVVALTLTGFSLRLAVTSVGSVLDDIERDLHTNGVLAGLLTTLPVISFAVLGALAPGLGARLGLHRGLVLALAVSVAGFVARAFAPDIGSLLGLSVVTLAGAAVANVLLPSLVKLHFPDRVAAMTAVYATALAVGTTAAAGLTIPIGRLGGGDEPWRLGLGAWAVFPALALLPWLSTLRGDQRAARGDTRRQLGPRDLLRSRTAWRLTLFFGAQSAMSYIGFGQLAHFLSDHGIGETTAGLMVAVLSGLGIPVTMLVPLVPPARHRALVAALVAAFAVSFVGLDLAPVGGAWVWMVLFGIGAGLFPVALTMIGLRTRTAETTAATSAFVQAIGYVIAGAGPLLFGALFSATGGWAAPLALLWVFLVITAVAAWLAAAPTYVDDEIGLPA